MENAQVGEIAEELAIRETIGNAKLDSSQQMRQLRATNV